MLQGMHSINFLHKVLKSSWLGKSISSQYFHCNIFLQAENELKTDSLQQTALLKHLFNIAENALQVMKDTNITCDMLQLKQIKSHS